eukprot:TRINITY_DN11658_c0_g2_i1.p1 TRINITY_DN11658_c0_g2~~TRINITY_DN11658_c0_g2_i1.p1  ORF type:complete len:337 (+),score=51.76 TRINITY_DN11658_c0_g2_i1:250-1260(+)
MMSRNNYYRSDRQPRYDQYQNRPPGPSYQSNRPPSFPSSIPYRSFTQVAIPGTSFSATTDDTGRYHVDSATWNFLMATVERDQKRTREDEEKKRAQEREREKEERASELKPLVTGLQNLMDAFTKKPETKKKRATQSVTPSSESPSPSPPKKKKAKKHRKQDSPVIQLSVKEYEELKKAREPTTPLFKNNPDFGSPDQRDSTLSAGVTQHSQNRNRAAQTSTTETPRPRKPAEIIYGSDDEPEIPLDPKTCTALARNWTTYLGETLKPFGRNKSQAAFRFSILDDIKKSYNLETTKKSTWSVTDYRNAIAKELGIVGQPVPTKPYPISLNLRPQSA